MDLNTLSGIGGFSEGLAGGLNQGLNRAEAAKAREEANSLKQLLAKMQTEREMGKIQTKEEVASIDGAEANQLASGVAGKPMQLFTPGMKYHRSQVDSIVGNLKPSKQGGGITGSGLRGLSGILGKFITTADNNRLSAVEPAIETHNTLVDLWNAYNQKDVNGQSAASNKLLTIMRSEASKNPNLGVWLQSQKPDPKNIPAMYEMAKRFAAAETNKLISGSIATPSEEGMEERAGMYPALGVAPSVAQKNFNVITDTQILGGIKGIKDKMNIWKEIPDVKPYAAGFQQGLQNYEDAATKRVHNIQGFDVEGGAGVVPEVTAQQKSPNIVGALKGMLAPKPTPAVVPTPGTGGGAFGGKTSFGHLWGE